MKEIARAKGRNAEGKSTTVSDILEPILELGIPAYLSLYPLPTAPDTEVSKI